MLDSEEGSASISTAHKRTQHPRICRVVYTYVNEMFSWDTLREAVVRLHVRGLAPCEHKGERWALLHYIDHSSRSGAFS